MRACFPITIGPVGDRVCASSLFPRSVAYERNVYTCDVHHLAGRSRPRRTRVIIVHSNAPPRRTSDVGGKGDKVERTRLREVMAVFRIPILNDFCRFSTQNPMPRRGGSRCICPRHEKIFSTRSRVLMTFYDGTRPIRRPIFRSRNVRI